MAESGDDSASKKRRRRPSGVKMLLVFAIFWTLIVGAFDGLLVFITLKQHAAASYPTVTGTIVSSEISSSTDSDGDTTYSPEVSFTYVVSGVTYNESGHRYGSFGSSSRSYARRVVNRYPAGKKVDVHYHPDDHSEAVLEAGIGGTEHALLLFLTPFNCVAILLWTSLGGIAIRRATNAPAGGVQVIRRPNRTIVRLPRWTPGVTAVVAALCVSFVSVFIVAFIVGFDAPSGVLQIVWSVMAAAAIVAYFWRLFVINSGAKDLVIDHESQTVTLPKSFGRSGDEWCPIDRIDKLRVKTITRSGNSNDTYAPVLEWRDEHNVLHEEKLAEWIDTDRAQQFIDWLRGALDQSDSMA